MKTRLLRNELELTGFIQAAEKIHGIRYPMDYLKRSRVVGFFDRNLCIRGGFLLATEGPFRTLESLPHGHDFEHHIPLKRAAELNALWVDQSHIGAKSALLWVRMFLEMIRSRKTHFLYTYSLKDRALGAIYASVRPTIVYRGLTKVLPGMKQPDEESIEYFKIWSALAVLIRDPSFPLRKKKGTRYRKQVGRKTTNGVFPSQ